jgi:adenylosuccinate synthase
MSVTILIGAQWGDEGKGRFVDWLAADAQIVARYSGGDNAGHTVADGEHVYKLHLIPSGVLRAGVVSVMGNGMVINPISLLREIDELAALGIKITPENLLISNRAHIITPAHIARDKASEKARGADAIGTTLRGIGPAYLDKTGRSGIRIGQMLDVETFAEAMRANTERANAELLTLSAEPLDPDSDLQAYVDAAYRLRPFIKDTSLYLHQQLQTGAQVICEGAQGALLDIDHGSYPYVTSSSPTVGGALSGLGIGPRHVERVLGIAKAFSTRVGGGPMPTEQKNEVGDRLRGTGANFWDEYGTTTGRPRRCGWLDLVMLRYSAAINGFTDLAITKLDVLSGFDELKLCVGYEYDGERLVYPPDTTERIEKVIPIYESLPGWQEDLSGARTLEDLPPQARAYLQKIEHEIGLPILAVSVGPEREQLVKLA